jgi:dolichol kinase
LANYWLSEAARTFVLFAAAYACGLWVLRRGVRVNYTRKILHFLLFFVPLTLGAWLPFQGSTLTVVLSGLVFLASILMLSAPLRSRSTFLATAYAAFDRPEDRPYTLLWLTTQVLATYAVLIAVLYWLQQYGKPQLVFISVLVAALGDGLAEPVGVRFGRHTYRTRALFTDRRYTRSLEGSACVLASGILAVFAMRGQFDNQAQFLLALLLVPVLTTLAEAWSPHTWDGPFLYAVGGASSVAALELGGG